MKKTALISVIGVLAVGALQAQEVPPFTFSLGAGFVEPQRSTGRYTDIGWNAQAGVGFNFNKYLGAMVDARISIPSGLIGARLICWERREALSRFGPSRSILLYTWSERKASTFTSPVAAASIAVKTS